MYACMHACMYVCMYNVCNACNVCNVMQCHVLCCTVMYVCMYVNEPFNAANTTWHVCFEQFYFEMQPCIYIYTRVSVSLCEC